MRLRVRQVVNVFIVVSLNFIHSQLWVSFIKTNVKRKITSER